MRARLRAETSELHRRVERASPFGPGLARDGYVRHLVRRLGFRAAIEPALARWFSPPRPWVPGPPTGTALLRSDLDHFGWAPAELDAVATCAEVHTIPSFAAALGAVYVLAGARLGGHAVAPRVGERLGLGERGLGFLRGGCDPSEARRQFTHTLDAIDEHAATVDEPGRAAIVAGARATFAALARWLERGP